MQPTSCMDSPVAAPTPSLRAAEELGVLTEPMPERLRLMVTLASWCALRFGETVELRRGDIDLSSEVIRVRRAAVRTKGAYTTHPSCRLNKSRNWSSCRTSPRASR